MHNLQTPFMPTPFGLFPTAPRQSVNFGAPGGDDPVTSLLGAPRPGPPAGGPGDIGTEGGGSRGHHAARDRISPLRVFERWAFNGESPTEAVRNERAYLTAQEQHAEAMELADRIQMSDRERLQFLGDPEGFFKANATRFEAFNLGQGDVRQFGENGGRAYNDRTGIDGGVPYRIDEEGQGFYGTPRPMGADEAADDARARERQAEDARHNQQTEKLAAMGAYTDREIGTGRLGLDRERLDFERSRPPNSVGDVVAPIFDKISRGEALTPGEQAALDSYNTSKVDPLMRELLGGDDMAAPAPQSRPAPRPGAPAARPRAPRLPASLPQAPAAARPNAPATAGPRARPGPPSGASAAPRTGRVRQQGGIYQPNSQAEFSQVPPGALFRNPADGKVMRKRRQ